MGSNPGEAVLLTAACHRSSVRTLDPVWGRFHVSRLPVWSGAARGGDLPEVEAFCADTGQKLNGPATICSPRERSTGVRLTWIFRAVSNDGLMWLRCAAG